jgi:hypothetical protein
VADWHLPSSFLHTLFHLFSFDFLLQSSVDDVLYDIHSVMNCLTCFHVVRSGDTVGVLGSGGDSSEKERKTGRS